MGIILKLVCTEGVVLNEMKLSIFGENSKEFPLFYFIFFLVHDFYFCTLINKIH